MQAQVAEAFVEDGTPLKIYRVFPGDPLVQFLRNRLAQGKWPASAELQSWGPFVKDGASFAHGTQELPKAHLYVACLVNGTPVACAGLMAKDMTRQFDPNLPAHIESLTPWRCCVAEHPDHTGSGFATIVSNWVLLVAKKLGFSSVHLFTDIPDEGVPDTWRGVPCQLIWTGTYYGQPNQMVLKIPLTEDLGRYIQVVPA